MIWGAKDTVLPIKEGRATHAAIAGSHFRQLPTGHVPFSSQPNEFLEVLMPFLESVAPARVTPQAVDPETVDG